VGWDASFDTHIWIFAVGRGNAAFIRTGMNHGFILDMNAVDFDVAQFVREKFVPRLDLYAQPNSKEKGRKIAQAILSHPHGDHISQCAELQRDRPLHPALLTCPHDKSPDGGGLDERLNWKRICNRESDAENVRTYQELYRQRTLPLQTIQYVQGRNVPNLEYGIFYIRPPVCEKIHPNNDNEYGNSTCIMFYLRHGNSSILFPGDMTPQGMGYVLAEREGVEKRYTKFNARWAGQNPNQHCKTGGQPSLKSLLGQGLTVLVAPHHGLESCYCPSMFAQLPGRRPRLVVISERIKTHENDGDTDPKYNCGSGLLVDIEGRQTQRPSVHTKQDHHLLIVFQNSGGVRVYADRDPNRLFDKV
jgi:hypothetical protein